MFRDSRGWTTALISLCLLGACSEDGLTVDTGACEAGYILVDGKCEFDCPPGERFEDGACVSTCPPGYVESVEGCVIDCSPGEVRVSRDECALECRDGYELIDLQTCGIICAEGFERVEPDKCEPICTADEYLVDGQCVPRGALEGRICNGELGEWWSGVVVVLNLEDGTNLSALSDFEGAFRIDRIPPGSHDLELRKPNGVTDTIPIRVRSGETTTVGASECSLPPELCNGVDDDYDGDIDEDPQDAQIGVSCFEAPSELIGIGQCAGGAIACLGGALVCDGWVGPALQETCDGVDNDCDGSLPVGEEIMNTTQSDTWIQIDPPAVDILFVVDNSGSMSDGQANLANNFSSFISVFTAQAAIDYHVGIITTDSSTLVGGYIDSNTADPVSTFVARATVGTGGSSTERGLAMSVNALSGGANSGFMRSSALLSVIYVSDEDDWSTSTVSDYIGQLISIKAGDPNGVLASAIVGDDPGGCYENSISASAGTRYVEVADHFGGIFASFCQADWAASMQQLGVGTFYALTRFTTSTAPQPGSIVVTICEGTTCADVPEDSVDGWSYDPVAEAVVLNGGAIPAAGDEITITYNPACQL